MTRLEMVTMVQKLVGDTSGTQFDTSFIISMLNAGQDDVAKKTKALPRRSTASLSSGTDSYELPEDFIQLMNVKVDGRTLSPIPMASLDAFDPTRELNDATGSPVQFFSQGRTLFLYPIPDTSVTTLDIWYIKRPALLDEDADVCELPLTMHEDVVRYAIMRCKELDEEFEQASYVKEDLRERMIESKDEISGGNADSYPAVRLLPGDY